jgi:hypothetical protein
LADYPLNSSKQKEEKRNTGLARSEKALQGLSGPSGWESAITCNREHAEQSMAASRPVCPVVQMQVFS